MTTENDLIIQARQFQESALAEIYDLYSPGVYRYAVRLLGETQLAEECVADTFFRYLQALRSGGGPADHLQAYLYRIAHNWITDFYRRQPPPSLPLDDEIPDVNQDMLKNAVQSFEKQAIRRALMQLTAEQRQVVLLKFLEGWDNETVAGLINKPVGAVKALQHRALNTLRRLLVPEEE
ncbi:MAG: RNA polymerase sigma factor [Anaerolineae bacterium]|nr:RNA polymerase sigma factor [Anaerolineae bacterium]